MSSGSCRRWCPCTAPPAWSCRTPDLASGSRLSLVGDLHTQILSIAGHLQIRNNLYQLSQTLTNSHLPVIQG